MIAVSPAVSVVDAVTINASGCVAHFVAASKSAHPAVLKDYQQEIPSGRLAHIDLHEVRLDEAIQTQVSVELVGEPVGVTEGGVLSQVNREINIEALP